MIRYRWNRIPRWWAHSRNRRRRIRPVHSRSLRPGLATTVVPATSVQPTDLVVNPNANPPTGTVTTNTPTQPTTGTKTTTTTTTTNPDGSVTTTSTETGQDTAPVSCAAGNHESRTFGSILQEHMNLWAGVGPAQCTKPPQDADVAHGDSDLLAAVESVGHLHAGLLGLVRDADGDSIDHHRDRGVRGLQDHLCGGTMTALLTLIYCFLMDMIASFKDIWLVGWDSILVPVDALLASVGTGGLTVPVIADQYAWLLGATGMSQAIAIIAGAMGVRFLLQSVPFVRWGS